MNTLSYLVTPELPADALCRQTLDALPLVFFDVETTGLFPSQGHRICELALLRVCNGEIQAQFSTLVDPQRPLEARAFAINGISEELLRDAPPFRQIAAIVQELLDDAVVIAHNAPFDMAFLGRELMLLGRPLPANPVFDTLVLARRLLRRHSYSLKALSCDLGLSRPEHRAMSDVWALYGLFRYLAEQLAALGITALGDVLRYQRGLFPEQPDPVQPPLVSQALREGRQLRIIYRSRSSPEPTERYIYPLELTQERSGVFLRAFCFLRDDWRSFALDKIEVMELV
ncbi:MAG: WYL domain-containing protein [Chloroflexales bacterium]|nr:WYL domain-containing protein [Chloroflexales bacterium]